MVGAYFYRVLCNEVVVHLWFDVDDSLRGERLHEGFDSGGKSRRTLLYGPSPDGKQLYISVFPFAESSMNAKHIQVLINPQNHFYIRHLLS